MIFKSKRRFLISTIALLTVGCSVASGARPLSFQLTVPDAFNQALEVKRYKTGDYLLNSPPFVEKAKYPITKYVGAWGPQKQAGTRERAWMVEVSLAPAAKIQAVLKACADAADASDAGKRVDEDGSYLFVRLERKSFRWGKAFSYLTQFTQDSGAYVPHNGHLTYEIWGVTSDERHVVHATFVITHPKLANWGPKVRIADSMEAMKKDRDYRLVESCAPGAFQPSLTEIDAMVDSLNIPNAR